MWLPAVSDSVALCSRISLIAYLDGLAHPAGPIDPTYLWPSFFRPHSAARAHFLLFHASFISFKKKQKTSGLQNGLQEPSFHDMTKVAYVLRFRHVEFTTLQNQLIFYQKKCWLRSVVNAILQICQFYKAFLMKNPSKNDPPIPTTPRPNRQKWCTYCVFAMSASPRCGTSMFFHKK